MVRINLIEPRRLADQHLVAEYNEILMLLGYVSRYPDKQDIPADFRLGKGHIRFFKDKLLYLRERHESIKKEMGARGFRTDRSIDLSKYPPELRNSWEPGTSDREIVVGRIAEKIAKKPGFYRYFGERRPQEFFLGLLKE